MSLQALLASKRLERHLTSPNELAGLRKLILRDMADAGVIGLSPDRTFATAYNAALQLSKLALSCAGNRVLRRSSGPPPDHIRGGWPRAQGRRPPLHRQKCPTLTVVYHNLCDIVNLWTYEL